MYDHVWHWHSRLPERKGTACRVVARSRRLGSVLVEFEDGFRVVTSRYAVRLQKGADAARMCYHNAQIFLAVQ